jgi:hypothetical protein
LPRAGLALLGGLSFTCWQTGEYYTKFQAKVNEKVAVVSGSRNEAHSDYAVAKPRSK